MPSSSSLDHRILEGSADPTLGLALIVLGVVLASIANIVGAL